MNINNRITVIIGLFISYIVIFGWAFGVYSSSFQEQYPLLKEEFKQSLNKNVIEYRPLPGMDAMPGPSKYVSLVTFLTEIKSSNSTTVFHQFFIYSYSRWPDRYYIYCNNEKLYFMYILKIDVDRYGLFEVKFKVA